MSKRLLTAAVIDENEIFPFTELPEDMIILILKPLRQFYVQGLWFIFQFLSINKNFQRRFVNMIPVLYNDGYHAGVDSRGRINGVSHRQVARYMAPNVCLLDLSIDHRSIIRGSDLNAFYNVTSLSLHNMRHVLVEDIAKMSRLTSLDLSNQSQQHYHVYPNIHLLTNLKKLTLYKNSSISDNELSKMTGLVSLDLADNYNITYNGISTLGCLQSIRVTRRSRVAMDECYTRLSNLQNIDFEGAWDY